MRSENFGDGELLVLQVRIAGAGRPSPCVTLGSCFDLFKGSKVTDVLETLGQNKNKKKKRKKPIPNFTISQCNVVKKKNFLQRNRCWWDIGTSAERWGIPQQNSCLELRNPEKNAGGSQLIFGTFFTYFLFKQNSWKMVGKFVIWVWLMSLGENLSCCPTPHCSVVLPSILAFRAGPRPVTALPNHGDGGWPIQRGSSRQTFFNIFNYVCLV